MLADGVLCYLTNDINFLYSISRITIFFLYVCMYLFKVKKNMDNWERLILYRKKLVLPRIYQLVDWFSWVACLAAVLFIAVLVYRYGFTVTDSVHSVLHIVSNSVWVIFLVNTTLSHLFSNDEGSKFTVWTWLLDIGLYLTLLPVPVFLFACWDGKQILHSFLRQAFLSSYL